MSKFATKAAANMFCQARYEAAKSNERLSSREGAAEEIGIDRTRLRFLVATWNQGRLPSSQTLSRSFQEKL